VHLPLFILARHRAKKLIIHHRAAPDAVINRRYAKMSLLSA